MKCQATKECNNDAEYIFQDTISCYDCMYEWIENNEIENLIREYILSNSKQYLEDD